MIGGAGYLLLPRSPYHSLTPHCQVVVAALQNVLADSCYNWVKDSDETQLDCGGTTCISCPASACTYEQMRVVCTDAAVCSSFEDVYSRMGTNEGRPLFKGQVNNLYLYYNAGSSRWCIDGQIGRFNGGGLTVHEWVLWSS